MIIDDLNTGWPQIAIPPFETDPPLIVDTNAVLAFAIASQGLKPVAGQRRKIPHRRSGLDPVELQPGGPIEARECFHPMAFRESSGFTVAVAEDHDSRIAVNTRYVKRNELWFSFVALKLFVLLMMDTHGI